MSTTAAPLTGWEEFLLLPDALEGTHYELHDGEVVIVPPARAIHIYVQSLLVEILTEAAKGNGRAAQEFPYRPAKNLQFWYADVAYVPHEDWKAMRSQAYPLYAPPLIIEILSPSNTALKVERQRVAAFSAGTREFWVIDLIQQTVEISAPDRSPVVFLRRDTIPLSLFPGKSLHVTLLFDEPE